MRSIYPSQFQRTKTSPNKQGKNRALGSTISHNFSFNSILDGDFRPAAYEKIM